MDLSIVVPTLNEAARIEATAAAVRACAPGAELVVADGGSSDGTAEHARAAADRVVAAPRGRARQMNAGAHAAGGDVLLFLHADTLLTPACVPAMRRALQAPGAEAGAFRLRFDRDAPLLRFYARWSHLPWPLLCFGDRGLFVRRAAFEDLGGFPDVPIFEDLEMVRRLHARGGFRFTKAAVVTAARRFERYGTVRQQLLNLSLWTRYVLGTPPHELAHRYRYGDP